MLPVSGALPEAGVVVVAVVAAEVKQLLQASLHLRVRVSRTLLTSVPSTKNGRKKLFTAEILSCAPGHPMSNPRRKNEAQTNSDPSLQQK